GAEAARRFTARVGRPCRDLGAGRLTTIEALPIPNDDRHRTRPERARSRELRGGTGRAGIPRRLDGRRPAAARGLARRLPPWQRVAALLPGPARGRGAAGEGARRRPAQAVVRDMNFTQKGASAGRRAAPSPAGLAGRGVAGRNASSWRPCRRGSAWSRGTRPPRGAATEGSLGAA